MQNFINILNKKEINYSIENDNLTVGGYLDLEGTNITSLPDNLTVGGSLDLRGTNITSLPDNLTVGGSLDLEGTNITSLPDNLTVIAYRTITGACSFGTENFLENNKKLYKDKMTLKEVIKATQGQYGHNTFKEFFKA